MIIKAVLDVFLGVLGSLFNLLPTLPSLPPVITDYWNQFTAVLISGASFLGVWFDTNLVISCISLSIVIHNFDFFYKLIAWFVDKIPFLSIKL